MPSTISGIFGAAMIAKPMTVTNLGPTSAAFGLSKKAYRPNQTMTAPRRLVTMDRPVSDSSGSRATRRRAVEDRAVAPYSMPHIMM